MGAVVKYSLYFSASVVCTASRYICAFSSDQSPLCPHRCLEEAEQLDSRKMLLHFAAVLSAIPAAGEMSAADPGFHSRIPCWGRKEQDFWRHRG